MMRVLLDCDGVLGDFVSEVLRFLNLYAPAPEGRLPFTLDDVKDFDVLESLGRAHMQERLDRHMAETDFCRYMPVYPGAQSFVATLRSFGHEVICVTSPYTAVPTWCHSRVKWLREHFDIQSYDVIFAKRKELVAGDWLVDDREKNVVDFGERAILLDRPWNQKTRGAFRAHTYTEALDRILWTRKHRTYAL